LQRHPFSEWLEKSFGEKDIVESRISSWIYWLFDAYQLLFL